MACAKRPPTHQYRSPFLSTTPSPSPIPKMKALYLLFFGIGAIVIANPIKQLGEAQQPAQSVKLSIALQPESRQHLEQTLRHLSNPSSARYGQYLGRKEAKALLRPRQSSADAVNEWLFQAGIPARHVLSDGQFIHVQTNSEGIEALLGVNYNATLGSQMIPASSLPYGVQSHVTTVQYAPIYRRAVCSAAKLNVSSTNLDPEQVRSGQYLSKARTDWERCKAEITPTCLRKLYHVEDYQARHEKENLLGVVGFDSVSLYLLELYSFRSFLDTSLVI